MSSVIIDILVLVMLFFVNAFFALSEIAIVSSRKARLQHLINRGNKRAKLALEMANDPTMFLSSVQIGITMVGVLAGAFGGATLSTHLAGALAHIPWLTNYRGPLSFILVVAVITYFSLIIGELVPKRLALNNPERFAVRIATPMRGITRIFAPLVTFLSASSDLVISFFGLRHPPEPPVSDEEIRLLFEEGVSAGVFERTEKEIVERMFRLSDRCVNSIMTLRPDIIWLDLQESPEEIAQIISQHPFSAYPACKEDVDHVIGIVLARDMVARVISEQPIYLPELVQEALFLPEGSLALRAIKLLQERGTHIAIVINEYGGTEGLLTMTDIVNSLIGEMVSPNEEPPIVHRPDGSLLVDGLLPIDDLKPLLHATELPHEEEMGYRTLAGFIMTYLGKVPHTGDAFDWGGYHFEIIDMDGNRIDRVLITRLPPAYGKAA